MWPVVAAMAAMGALQYRQQQAKEKRDRELAAATQQYSPWTGLQAGPVQEADLVGTVGQGAVQGLAMGQNMKRADQADKLTNAQIDYYKANTPGEVTPVGSMEDNPVARQQMGKRLLPWQMMQQNPYAMG